MAFTISAEALKKDLNAEVLSEVPSSSQKKEFDEGSHQLEKLEFALAIAQTRGDQVQSEKLQAQINALGGNIEEPGT